MTCQIQTATFILLCFALTIQQGLSLQCYQSTCLDTGITSCMDNKELKNQTCNPENTVTVIKNLNLGIPADTIADSGTEFVCFDYGVYIGGTGMSVKMCYPHIEKYCKTMKDIMSKVAPEAKIQCNICNSDLCNSPSSLQVSTDLPNTAPPLSSVADLPNTAPPLSVPSNLSNTAPSLSVFAVYPLLILSLYFCI